MPKCVKLDVDGRVTIKEYNGIDDIYATIGRGCNMFQCLPCHPLQCDVLMDEEGKMNGQPLNVVATAYFRTTSVIVYSDDIRGAIMFVGSTDADGESTDIDPAVGVIVRSVVRNHYGPDVKFECDEECAVHTPECDGNCDHLVGHLNACVSAMRSVRSTLLIAMGTVIIPLAISTRAW